MPAGCVEVIKARENADTASSVLSCSAGEQKFLDMTNKASCIPHPLPRSCVSCASSQVPFDVDQSWDKKYTYLDTQGRPVLVLKRGLTLPVHNQPFAVDFQFTTLALLREPMLLVSGKRGFIIWFEFNVQLRLVLVVLLARGRIWIDMLMLAALLMLSLGTFLTSTVFISTQLPACSFALKVSQEDN